MAVINEPTVISAFSMFGCPVIRLPKVLGGLTLDQQIQKLFANGEQGFAYNPNDLSTMYQDAAGTIPVTAVGQPVGLMLDKSSHLKESAELNPDTYFKDSDKWSLTRASIVDEKLIFTDALTNSNARISRLTELGKWYKITITVDSISGQLRVMPFSPNYAPAINFDIVVAGTYTAIMQAEAAATPALLVRTVGASTTAVISFLSIKELSGNHAYQTTSASRPILRQNAVTGANYLEFDNVDDYLQISNAALPSPMSTMFAVDSSVDGYSILLSAGSAGYINLTTTGIGLDGPNGLGTKLTRNVPKDVVSYKFANSSVNMKTATGEATISSGNSFSTSSIKYIGRFSPTGAAKFGGNIYGIVVITKELSTAEESTLRQLFNKRLGV